MDRVNIEDFCCADDRGNIQITLGGRSRADTGSLVGKSHMKRIAIYVAVNSNGFDAHLFTGPDNTAGYLAPIGN